MSSGNSQMALLQESHIAYVEGFRFFADRNPGKDEYEVISKMS